MACNSKNGSTEDLWSEDQYLPDSYLPTPDYMVSVSSVQPDHEIKQEVDETWDYNYEDQRTTCNKKFPFERHYHSLGILRDDRQRVPTEVWRKYSEPADLPSSRDQQQQHSNSNTDEETNRLSDCRRWINRRCYGQTGGARRKSYSRPSSVHYPPTQQQQQPRHIRPMHYPSMRRPSYSTRHLRPIRFEDRNRSFSSTSSTEMDSIASPSMPRRKATYPQQGRHLPARTENRRKITVPALPKIHHASGEEDQGWLYHNQVLNNIYF